MGSSPRTWGEASAHAKWVAKLLGFIPTHVGRSVRMRRKQGVELQGSSPRTWGEAIRSSLDATLPGVHPHARGEKGERQNPEILRKTGNIQLPRNQLSTLYTHFFALDAKKTQRLPIFE